MDLGLTLIAAAEANDSRLPGELSQELLLAVDAVSKASSDSVKANRFELVYKGSLLDVAGSTRIIFREKDPTKLITGEWVKTYGFTDGHVESIRVSDPDGFAVAERQVEARK